MRGIELLLVSFAMFAQNATVYDLTPAESSEGARLYREMKTADDAYHAWEGKMKQKAAIKNTVCFDNNAMSYSCSGALEFTVDFKHAVPKAPAPQQVQGYHAPCLGVAW